MSSGVWISQDLFEATRPVLFETEFDDFSIATHGGTLFLISTRDRLFGISPKHVLGRTGPDQFVPEALYTCQHNREPRGDRLRLKCAYSMEVPPEETLEGTHDAFDLMIWEFQPPEANETSCYLWDSRTITAVKPSAKVMVVGFLKDTSAITSLGPNVSRSDVQPFKAVARHVRNAGDDECGLVAKSYLPAALVDKIGSLKGLSGSPVYDLSQESVCGMVIRGGLHSESNLMTLRFMSAKFIDRALQSIVRDDPTIDVVVHSI